MTPILLLEINEIPWRLLDQYAGRPEFRNTHRFLEGSHQFTSRAVDSGELSPWVTWPTRRMLNQPLRKSCDLVDADRIKHWLLAINSKGCGEIDSLCAA